MVLRPLLVRTFYGEVSIFGLNVCTLRVDSPWKIVRTWKEKDLSFKSLHLSKPISSAGYSEVQMRLLEQYFINLKVPLKMSVVGRLSGSVG